MLYCGQGWFSSFVHFVELVYKVIGLVFFGAAANMSRLSNVTTNKNNNRSRSQSVFGKSNFLSLNTFFGNLQRTCVVCNIYMEERARH